MKNILLFALLGATLARCTSSGYNAKATSYGLWTTKPKEFIVDAWIKTSEVSKKDSLIVRTEKTLYFTTEIPYSETIKFSVRTAILDTVFLESKKQNKQMFFLMTKKHWGKLQPLH
jgi:hypothetical protein